MKSQVCGRVEKNLLNNIVQQMFSKNKVFQKEDRNFDDLPNDRPSKELLSLWAKKHIRFK